MKRKVALLAGLVVLLCAGAALAVATTGTQSVCATATTPAHTIKVDTTAVSTIAGASSTQCVTTTYTIPTTTVNSTTTVTNTQTVTNTVTQTVTAPPTTGSAPWGVEYFGGGISSVYTAAQLSGAGMIEVSGGFGDASYAKNAAPAAKVLLYVDASIVRTDGGSGLDYSTASSSGYLTSTAYTNGSGQVVGYYADVTNQNYWTWVGQQVVALVQANPGADGIILDDVSRNVPSSPISSETYTANMPGLVQAVGSALHAHGMYFGINASGYVPYPHTGYGGSDDGTNWTAWAEQLAPYIDMVHQEYWEEAADGTNTLRLSSTSSYQYMYDSWFSGMQKVHADFPNLVISATTHGDLAHAIYGRASLELADPAATFFDDGINTAWTSCPKPVVNSSTTSGPTASCT